MAEKGIKLNSGCYMPRIALGTWQATDTKSGEVEEAIKLAIDIGYRHIDCAYLYGTEPDVGRGIAAKIKDGTIKREDIFVTTKLWNAFHGADNVKAGIKLSLKNLQLDYLDLYLIHQPMPYKCNDAIRAGKEMLPIENNELQHADIPHTDTWAGMEKCADEGLAKSIGVSNFSSKQLQKVLDKCRIVPAVNQIESFPYFSNERLIKFCQDKGIAIMAYGPLGSGARPWKVLESEPDPQPVVQHPELIAIGKKYGKTSAQVSLRWLLQRDLCVIPKSVNPRRIRENFSVSDFSLTSQDMTAINKLNRDMRLFTYNAFKSVVPPGIEDNQPLMQYRPFVDEF